MKNIQFTIQENRMLAKDVFLLKLQGDESFPGAPGQFVNIRLDGLYLRRPLSICDLQGNVLTLICKVVGKGTRQLSQMLPGERLDLLTGLGNGYDLTKAGSRPVLLGGGAGVPPMYYLAKQLLPVCDTVTVILGFNTREEIFFEEEFRALGAEVIVTTVDGSYGVRGFATDAWPASYSYFYTCGPEPMLKAVFRSAKTSGQFSFEQRMGCGFGACMGCSCQTVTGYKRICKDGPVLEKEEILW